MTGTLFVVATPIGNLEDITYRAVRVLGEVDLIAAEDTRHSRKLLDHYGIQTPLISYHDHNEVTRSEHLLVRLLADESIALISDAGTPCIADPGYQLINRCHQQRIPVVGIPGPVALVTALAIAGLPTESFRFLGFLPAKMQARRKVFELVRMDRTTLVCYETPHRLLSALKDMLELFGEDRQMAIARELTKRHEELFRGSVGEALAEFSRRPAIKGELVLIIAPPPAQPAALSVRASLQQLRAETDLSWKQIVKQVAREQGVPGSDVYRESLELRK